tara:strand:- start:4189 stop:5847 length:1659 start_codon:yes stop_codon:yes gene_type:complete
MSDQNRIRLISKQPIRGKILDKNGKVLVNNKLSYSLIIKPQFIESDDWISYKFKLSKLFNINEAELQKNYDSALRSQNYSITILDQLSTEQLIKFEENEKDFSGIEISKTVIRNYPYKSLAAHAIGYISPITSKEYRTLLHKGYRLNDFIGRTGIESFHENLLRGSWGGEMIEVNASGEVQDSLGIKPAKKGKDVYLTLDLDLQKKAEEVLRDKKGGSIIVMDPRNGAIRAIASKPTFDLNFFTKEFKSEKEFNRLFFSDSKPLLNRALNAYDPGSVWKIVTALAGLESGKYPPDTLLETKPCINYGSQCFREHNDKGFGTIGYEDALRVSSNTFFYQIGYGTGVDEIYKISKKLGFAQMSGIELSEQENIGLIANSDWAKSGRGWGTPGQTPWVPEDIASMSIGQFVVQVSPIQIARAYAAIANGGYLITPHLSKTSGFEKQKKDRIKIDIDPVNLEIIKTGLRQVVLSGTGASLNIGMSNIPPVSGKTGTAEDGTGGLDHAWFVCFTPSEKTELLVVAFAENTPGGGAVHALPMAKQILEVWNNKQKVTN